MRCEQETSESLITKFLCFKFVYTCIEVLSTAATNPLETINTGYEVS